MRAPPTITTTPLAAGRLTDAIGETHLHFEYDVRDRVVSENQQGATLTRHYDDPA
ncbi:hypothetical protein [Aeromonas sp. 5HA1]|uniref:hypothetical protein n=1 Tax=Aeromonas sp. 5HA1 TaxID=2699197 RepID=UPI0023DE17A9|nr:hypothetical protein [Aeromonas sp. 5HA1]MDF2403338.1 hypothetical protein [Aeromonas sp. 5HA1]